MFKRIITPVLIVIILLFTSCSQIFYSTKKITRSEIKNTNSKNSLKIDKTKLDSAVKPSPYYKKIELNSGYNTLSSYSERRVYSELLAHCTDFTDEPDSSYENNYIIEPIELEGCDITRRQLARAVMAFYQDNPQVFWLAEPYSYSISATGLTVKLYATMTQAQYSKKLKQLNAVINDILKNLKKGMSEFERELYIHDYIVKNCKYLKNPDEKHKDPYSIYGCLVNQSAVCMGYTSAFQLLLSYAGINSVAVYGDNTENGHIWNAVEIGGDWYYTDVTWDDTGDFFMYDNFNITTAQLKRTHKIVPGMEAYNDDELFGKDGSLTAVNLIIPKCTAVKYNYYRYKGSVIKSLSDNKLSAELAKAAESRKRYFYIYVHPGYLNYKNTYDKLFGDSLFLFSEYIKEANSILGSDVLKMSVSVSEKKSLNTICVELKYN